MRLIGSSPRVWGKQDVAEEAVLIGRVIPTRVGKAVVWTVSAASGSGHPHACGESHGGGEERAGVSGSSPRVWGKRAIAREEAGGFRVIPTRVGKAGATRSRSGVTTGHPHACGESCRLRQSSCVEGGSSPRVWGKLEQWHDFRPCSRVIPTRVGKAVSCRRQIARISGHPHACGESPSSVTRSPSASGSSPRVWGKRGSLE